MKKLLFTFFAILALTIAAADEIKDRAAVMYVLESFFSGMTAKDITSLQKIMTEDGVLYGYRESAEGLSFFNVTHAAYLEGLATRQGVPVERIWNPKIDLHDRIAIVWAPYDFHSDGVFSHCGMNTFSLLNGDEGWKITGVVFSVRTENCEDSPLGPLEAHD